MQKIKPIAAVTILTITEVKTYSLAKIFSPARFQFIKNIGYQKCNK
jgi:hypothetical protein